MTQIGQAVDHRDGGFASPLLDDRMVERPDDEPVEIARENTRRVRDALASR